MNSKLSTKQQFTSILATSPQMSAESPEVMKAEDAEKGPTMMMRWQL